jgi:hypothetical protein
MENYSVEKDKANEENNFDNEYQTYIDSNINL